MKWTRESQLENESELAFRNFLPKAWIVRDKDPDVGIDMEIEIVEDEEVTNKIIWVRLKATEKVSTKKEISYSMETKHLRYYEGCPVPVIIVYWIKPEKKFYYLFAQKYIQEIITPENPNWREQKNVTIKFSPTSSLDTFEKLKSIATEGHLYIIRQQLAARDIQFWLDGIPESNNEKLKERTLKALLFLKNERYREAVKEFENILKVYTIFPTERMAILLSLGNAYYSLSKFNEALENYNAILELAEKVNGKDALEGKSAALGNIGLIYSDKGDLDNALKYHQDALAIHREIGYKQGEASDLGNIGLILRAKGDLDNALKYFQDALEIFNIAAPSLITKTLNNIATLYFEKGNNEKGFEHLAKAISSSTSSEQFNASFSTLLRIIRNMIVHNDWEKLQSINRMYSSGIIKERSLVNFLKAFYEYTLYKITSEEQHKTNFENLKGKLEPGLLQLIHEILEEKI